MFRLSLFRSETVIVIVIVIDIYDVIVIVIDVIEIYRNNKHFQHQASHYTWCHIWRHSCVCMYGSLL